MTFIITEKPTIKATVKNVTVVIGGNNVTVVTGGIAEQNIAILQCDRPMLGCPPAPVHWRYKDKDSLSNSSHYTIITNSNYTKLIISGVNVNDSGMYECGITDRNTGIPYSDHINLTVSSEQFIISLHAIFALVHFAGAVTQTINASLCSNQLLSCDCTPSPAADYQWIYYDGVNITTNEISPNSSLNLLAIRSSDFGMYYCRFIPSPYGGTIVTQLLLVQQIGQWFYTGKF